MAKTVIGLLIGIALHEGAIGSIDDLSELYVPGLKGSEYGRTPIKALLQMLSGVQFREVYWDTTSDINTLALLTLGQDPLGSLAAVARFNTRLAEPGQRFSYSSAEFSFLALCWLAPPDARFRIMRTKSCGLRWAPKPMPHGLSARMGRRCTPSTQIRGVYVFSPASNAPISTTTLPFLNQESIERISAFGWLEPASPILSRVQWGGSPEGKSLAVHVVSPHRKHRKPISTNKPGE